MKQILQLQGMHCTSCAMNIDGALEELPGVQEANTSYARSKLEVSFDPTQVSLEKIVSIIEAEGLTAQVEGEPSAEAKTAQTNRFSFKSILANWTK